MHTLNYTNMGLVLFDAQTGKRVPFETADRKGSRAITWYTCGPTVYDSPHLGHARAYISVDIIRRVLERYFGCDVNLAMNVTDVDDKIIRKTNDKNNETTSATEGVAEKYEQEFWDAMDSLGVTRPTVVTHVSKYIPDIVGFVSRLIELKMAYVKQSSVYFDTKAYVESGRHSYGTSLLGQGSENDKELVSPSPDSGVNEDEDISDKDERKKNPRDFALWKAYRPDDGTFSWNSPWGKGRPGWHVECSAMARAVFGDRMDIHSGHCVYVEFKELREIRNRRPPLFGKGRSA